MKADVTKLTVLFELTRQFEVPFFQRPYVWNQADHWEPLWADIMKVIDENSTAYQRPHFLGAVILDRDGNHPSDSIEKRQIIDGQQRMITLQLVLAAARDIAATREDERSFGLLRDLVENPEYAVSGPEERPKILPVRPDNGAFSEIIIGKASVIRDDSNVVSCYRFFKESVSRWLAEDSKHKLEDLVHALKTYLQIVVIEIDANDDAQIIFETLNNRGQKLAQADLIWNFLVRESRKEENKPNNIYRIQADFLFQDRYWREQISMGRVNSPRIDAFMMHYLTMKQKTSVVIRDIYLEFQRWYGEVSRRSYFQSIVDDILRYGKIYRDWYILEDDEESRLLKNLNLLDINTWHPFFLWVFGHSDSELPKHSKSMIMKDVESFLFRRLISGLTSANFNKQVVTILYHLRYSSDIASDFRRRLASFKTRTTSWPEDFEIRLSLPSDKSRGKIKADRLKYVLERINRHMSKQQLGYEESIDYANLKVEQLMPRNWDSSDYPIGDDEEAKDHRTRLLDTIGNLTLITREMSPRVSRGPWDEKRAEIQRYSGLTMNQSLPEVWDDAAIQNRSREMANIICQIWPRPQIPELPDHSV